MWSGQKPLWATAETCSDHACRDHAGRWSGELAELRVEGVLEVGEGVGFDGVVVGGVEVRSGGGRVPAGVAAEGVGERFFRAVTVSASRSSLIWASTTHINHVNCYIG
jgi:hypothetical protein